MFILEEAFGDLKDPRRRGPVHDLNEMLMVALCAILCCADSWVAIQIWGEEKLDWQRRHTSLPNGIPSHDPFDPGVRRARCKAVRSLLYLIDKRSDSQSG